MIAALAPLAAAYKENGSTEALAELYDYLDNHTLALKPIIPVRTVQDQ